MLLLEGAQKNYWKKFKQLTNAFKLSQPEIETRFETLTITKEQKFLAATDGEVKRQKGVIYHYVPWIEYCKIMSET